MRRFLGRLLLFCVPLGVYMLALYLIDPFSFLNAPPVVPMATKVAVANQLNPAMWKMIQFRRNPRPNILIGDSRMGLMHADEVSRVAGSEYFNFSYGGGSLREMIDTFWFAQRQMPLRNVYIGLNLNVYNDYDYTQRTRTYLTIEGNPAIYFVNRTVVEAAFYSLYAATHSSFRLGVPPMSREDFWLQQLGPVTASFYRNYVYPDRSRRDLQGIAEFCQSHDIRLTFIIFPTSVELQNRVHDFHLESANAQFRHDLALMATTYDFDYPNEVTEQKSNYLDPYHFNGEVAARLAQEIWGGGPMALGRRIDPSLL